MMTPEATKFAAWLRENGACKEGYAAVRGQSRDEFVRTTKRGDWLVWLVETETNYHGSGAWELAREAGIERPLAGGAWGTKTAKERKVLAAIRRMAKAQTPGKVAA